LTGNSLTGYKILQRIFTYEVDLNKLDSVKVEDTERTATEVTEEGITAKSAIRSAILLAAIIIIGLLIMFGLEKYNNYHANQQIKAFISKAEAMLKRGKPQSAFTMENLEIDLTRLRDDNIDKRGISESINSVLRRMQDYPVYARTGTQYRSWATSEIVRTELDSVIVSFKDRNKFSFRTVYQPATAAESKAFALQQSHPDWTRDDCLRIVNRKLWAGMTKIQLQAAWGQPKAIDKNYTFGTNSEQWVYGNMGPYVYIENGIVTSWQE
jgi:hypothetical protein